VAKSSEERVNQEGDVKRKEKTGKREESNEESGRHRKKESEKRGRKDGKIKGRDRWRVENVLYEFKQI